MRKLTYDEIRSRRLTTEQMKSAERLPIIAVVDSVRSLYNVGSIFRTSDGARVERLILTGFTPHPPRPEIEKTALGATQTVPWEYSRDPVPPIEALLARGVTVCALEITDASIPYTEMPRSAFPLALVVGNEISGISKEILNLASLAIEIPMAGMKQSLNVAVAYGIALFELARICRAGTDHR
ncbi:MAG: RNA methyltransferase [Ignavibacteriales bacterium CG07_land_8_20_14_0_80_59_12]|nr:MAG: RNA methyltransferase [Ignavibacteriales bacterium CG07_land_8_20_14_0_80_59_12]